MQAGANDGTTASSAPVAPIGAVPLADTLVLPPALPALFADDTGDGSATDALADMVAGSVQPGPAGAAAETTDSPTQIAGGLVTLVPAPTAPESIKRLSSLGDDYSNWGNEGLW